MDVHLDALGHVRALSGRLEVRGNRGNWRFDSWLQALLRYQRAKGRASTMKMVPAFKNRHSESFQKHSGVTHMPVHGEV